MQNFLNFSICKRPISSANRQGDEPVSQSFIWFGCVPTRRWVSRWLGSVEQAEELVLAWADSSFQELSFKFENFRVSHNLSMSVNQDEIVQFYCFAVSPRQCFFIDTACWDGIEYTKVAFFTFALCETGNRSKAARIHEPCWAREMSWLFHV